MNNLWTVVISRGVDCSAVSPADWCWCDRHIVYLYTVIVIYINYYYYISLWSTIGFRIIALHRGSDNITMRCSGCLWNTWKPLIIGTAVLHTHTHHTHDKLAHTYCALPICKYLRSSLTHTPTPQPLSFHCLDEQRKPAIRASLNIIVCRTCSRLLSELHK